MKNKHEKKFNKLPIVIGIVIIIFIIIAVSIFFIIKSNKLSEEEILAAKVVKKYHDSLKNPNSMEIFEIRLYDTAQKDGKIVIMDASGQNGFGGMTRNKVAYDNKIEYIGNDSNANLSITKYTTNVGEILISKSIFGKWNGGQEYISVDVKKILKNYEKIK